MEESMGHVRLGVLPRYPKWKEVVSLLRDREAEAAAVADKALDAAAQTLATESAQSCVGYCVWLLAQLTLASRSEDFTADVARLGIQIDEGTSAAAFLAAVSRAATRHLATLAPQTALNEIAGLALRETLTRTVGIQAATLFGAGLEDARLSLAKHATARQFSSLLHAYFTTFLARTLRFVVDKEVTNHLGSGKRFESVDDVAEFEDALERFAGQTTRIVDQFSGGWYSKRVWQQGQITGSDAAGFVAVALRKLRADLALNEAQR